jgi:hypothetical protein
MCSLYRIFCTSLSISLYLHKASSCVLLANCVAIWDMTPKPQRFLRCRPQQKSKSVVMGSPLEAGCIVLENWWLRWDSNPHFADFKSVDSAVGLLSHLKERAQSTRECGPCQGKKLVAHKRIELLLID